MSQIGSLQQQINDLRGRVDDLSVGLDKIANLIGADSALEQQKQRQENEYEKQLAEQGLRQGKEKLLEQKLQNALLTPIKAIASKFQFGWDKLMKFFFTLFGGWLTLEGMKLLETNARGDTKKINDIKNAVLKNLAIVGGIFLLFNAGIFTTLGIIGRLSLSLSGFLFNNTIGKIFGGLLEMLGFKKPKPPEVKLPKAGETPTPGEAPKTGEAPKGEGGAPKGEFKGGGFFEGAGKIFNALFRIEQLRELAIDAQQGKWEDAITIAAGWSAAELTAAATSAGLVGLIPETLGGSLAGFLAVGAASSGAYFGAKAATKAFIEKYLPADKRELLNPSNKTSKPKVDRTKTNQPQLDFSKPPSFGDISGNVQSGNQSSAQSSLSTSAQINAIPSNMPNLGQPEEPKPNVVLLSSSQNQNPPTQPLTTGSATDVPLISSSNIDNFYSLYAQVNYNVIL